MDFPIGSDRRKEAAAASIEQLRSRLLDLSARNPLISFPHGRASGTRTYVRAVDGHIDDLFVHLTDPKPLALRALPLLDDEPVKEARLDLDLALQPAQTTKQSLEEAQVLLPGAAPPPSERSGTLPKDLANHATRLGIDPSFDLRPSETELAKMRERKGVAFQALLLPEDFEQQLAKIRETARTVAEETGVSTLHLAFGFLEWFESDVSDRPITSPLLLLRVDIERQIARSRYQYSVSSVGDEAEVNLTLSERLSRDFRIKLPPLAEEDTPEAYLARVREEVCAGRPRWTVRRFVTLAHFPFARLAMFQDLDESQWQAGLSSHPVLASLLAGREGEEDRFAAEHDVDAPEVSAKVPVLVLDADASQHSAIYDVMCGKDLVIEGPPGTGKSQTITNIVAAALSNGKRVLFVADKQAALQVVKDRLDKVGLGDFCLELHSGKARKTDVIASLARRLERPPVSTRTETLDEKISALTSVRAALTRYVDLLNTRFGALGYTLHDVLWADRRRRDGEASEGRRLDSLTLPAAHTLTEPELAARRGALDRFERAADPVLAFGNVASHPWRGVTRSSMPSVDMELAIREIGDTAASMAAMAEAAKALEVYGLPKSTVLDDFGPVLKPLAGLMVDTNIRADWLAALAVPETRDAALAWQRACGRYRSSLEAQSKWLDLPAGTDPSEAAERLRAEWSLVAAIVPAGISVADLSPWAAELHGKAAQLTQMHGIVSETALNFKLTSVDNLGEVAVVAAAVRLAAELPPPIAEFMTPELMRSRSAGVVVSTASAIRSAQSKRAALNADYSIPPTAEPGLLRQHAATLAAAGVFGFMSPAVKAAELCFAGLNRLPRKMSKSLIAAALMSIAENLEAAASIDADPSAWSAFGGAYRGLATDVDAALASVGWAARVRLTLSGSDRVTDTVSAVLLSGDPDRLRPLSSLASRPDYERLQTCLAEYPSTATSFEALASKLTEQAKWTEKMVATCLVYGIAGSTRASDLPVICGILQETAGDAAVARVPVALDAALGSTCPAPLDEHGPFEAALHLACTLDQLTLPEPMRHALCLTSPTMLGTVAVPAAVEAVMALGEAKKRWNALKERLSLDEAALLGSAVGLATPEQVSTRLFAATSHASDLGSWILYLRERETLEAIGLGGLLRLWDDRALPGSLTMAFDRVFHHALARAAFARHPELDRFSGLGQQEARTRFTVLDADVAALRRARLSGALADRPVAVGISAGKRSELTEKSLIYSEIGKQKRHIPIRQLLDRAGGAVQALKPCFMMSPLSVAQYLKPDGLRFDLLVIDEASQMRPEDAVGAIARCGQIVVVGDPKQLPPSGFFTRSERSDDDDAPEEEVDAESILDLAQAAFRPMRRLRWHYRSRHGSLIAFSNREFYDSDLLVFPSPAEADATQGVVSVKVDGLYQGRANLAEVTAVCQAAVEHMRTCPDRSLGIATMNVIQRDLIALEMDRLAATQPEIEEYRARWGETLERFFVKNLENVQGDERDVIFVSTVFGPATQGGKVLQRFGPIIGASGHRRLNVLFTRAKHHVRLFTSMTPEDVLAGPGSPRGAQVLKAYLAYAQTGRLEAGVETGKEADSDFEVFVRDRLQRAGYDAVPQVGVAGFRIDMAVRDPRSPATFLLGIECDGATYHSSRSARDRDILRQQILEGLGWMIYRIWSTDWFRDPDGQTKKLVAFVEQALANPPR